MNHSADLADLAAALIAAQADFPNIPKSKTVNAGKFSYSYAPFDAMVDLVRPVLAKHGLAVVQLLSGDGLETTLLHCSGQYISALLDLSSQHCSDMQDFGKRTTYARRYAYQSILGLATEEDTDAQGVKPAQNRRAPRPSAPRPSVPQKAFTNSTTDRPNLTNPNERPPDPASPEAWREQYIKR